jgi:hypothetical protein
LLCFRVRPGPRAVGARSRARSLGAAANNISSHNHTMSNPAPAFADATASVDRDSGGGRFLRQSCGIEENRVRRARSSLMYVRRRTGPTPAIVARACRGERHVPCVGNGGRPSGRDRKCRVTNSSRRERDEHRRRTPGTTDGGDYDQDHRPRG